MANFTVSNNYYLRQLYSTNKDLAQGSQRLKVNTKDLAKADTLALRKGIASLSDFDYDRDDEDSVAFYKTIKAFADSYNQTMETGDKLSEDPSTKRLMKEMKKLQDDYGDDLNNYGISFDSKGYMTLSESAFDNISVKKFKEIVGEDSEFMSELSKIQKKLSRRIDYLV